MAAGLVLHGNPEEVHIHRLPIASTRARLTADADGRRSKVDEVGRLGCWAAGGGVEVFVLGQLANQRFAGLGRRDIGLALLQPLELAIPGRQLGGWQGQDVVDLGD
ncbi:hypothetical protein D3C85_1598320 [compost metagenome]